MFLIYSNNIHNLQNDATDVVGFKHAKRGKGFHQFISQETVNTSLKFS